MYRNIRGIMNSRTSEILIILFAVTALTSAVPRTACAFHNGGVAACDGCHTMHNSSRNVPMTKNARPVDTGNAYLLLGTDPGSTCLFCHAGSSPTDSYKVATNPVPVPGSPPLQLTPG